MRAMLDNQRITLDASRTLGVGGEATVYGLTLGTERLAAKVYHSSSPERQNKLEALMGAAARLPSSVVLPRSLLFDTKGREAIGFVMEALPDGCEPIAQLCRKSFRETRGISRRETALLLARMGEELARLHCAGIVVGDLNDQNELFTLDLQIRFIDADSFQLPGFPCEVATEAFLDPLLYGPDLKAPCVTGGGPRRFEPLHDWYSFAVLAFRCLTGVHPYGGVLGGLPTLPERARARRSVFDEEVALPRAARESVGLLSRELAAAFDETFDRGARGSFPVSILSSYAREIVRCTCGLELPATRLPCPRCSVNARRAVHTPKAGLCVKALLETGGPIVALRLVGDTLRALAIEDGLLVIYQVDFRGTRREVLSERASKLGWDVSLSDTHVAFGPVGSTECAFVTFGSGTRTPFVTELASGRASFAAAFGSVYRVASGTLLAARHEGAALIETAVTAVMREQTRLVGGADVLLLSERILTRRHVVAIDGARRADLELDPLAPAESLLEESLFASPTGLAVARVTSLQGQRFVRTATFDRRGTARCALMTRASERLAGEAIHGGVLVGAKLVVATDSGLVREDLDGVEAPISFPETAPFVGLDAIVALAPSALLVAHERVVRSLTLRPTSP